MTPRAASIQRQGSLTLPRTLSQKTVDEVWRDIMCFGGPSAAQAEAPPPPAQRQQTLGEITLEEFLVRRRGEGGHDGATARTTVGCGGAAAAASSATANAISPWQCVCSLGASTTVVREWVGVGSCRSGRWCRALGGIAGEAGYVQRVWQDGRRGFVPPVAITGAVRFQRWSEGKEASCYGEGG